jgi:hypothetical protein
MYAAYLRYSILVDYERELCRLQDIMKNTRRTKDNRLITLQEYYPVIPRETLEKWRASNYEQIAFVLS